jgi:hypothetical protein
MKKLIFLLLIPVFLYSQEKITVNLLKKVDSSLTPTNSSWRYYGKHQLDATGTPLHGAMRFNSSNVQIYDTSSASWVSVMVVPAKTKFVSSAFTGMSNPFYSDITDAIAGASDGDLIEVFAGTYIETVITLRTGVNLYLHQGVRLYGRITDGGFNKTCNIDGNGILYAPEGDNAINISGLTSEIKIKCKSIISELDLTAVYISNGSINIECELIQGGDCNIRPYVGDGVKVTGGTVLIKANIINGGLGKEGEGESNGSNGGNGVSILGGTLTLYSNMFGKNGGAGGGEYYGGNGGHGVYLTGSGKVNLYGNATGGAMGDEIGTQNDGSGIFIDSCSTVSEVFYGRITCGGTGVGADSAYAIRMYNTDTIILHSGVTLIGGSANDYSVGDCSSTGTLKVYGHVVTNKAKGLAIQIKVGVLTASSDVE